MKIIKKILSQRYDNKTIKEISNIDLVLEWLRIIKEIDQERLSTSGKELISQSISMIKNWEITSELMQKIAFLDFDMDRVSSDWQKIFDEICEILWIV